MTYYSLICNETSSLDVCDTTLKASDWDDMRQTIKLSSNFGLMKQQISN